MSNLTWSLQHKRATAAQWTADNPTLLAGQFGWESDTNKLKIGDGTTAWNSLGYFGNSGGTWGSITGTLSDQTDLNTALGLKAPLSSPAFTDTPTAPTASLGTNTTQLATTAFVAAALAAHTSTDYTTIVHAPSGNYLHADNNYYWFAQPNVAVGNGVVFPTNGNRAMPSIVSGTVRAVIINLIMAGTTYSSEATAVTLRDDTANVDHAVGNISFNHASTLKNYVFTGLSIPVVQGNLLLTVFAAVNYATNPNYTPYVTYLVQTS